MGNEVSIELLDEGPNIYESLTDLFDVQPQLFTLSRIQKILCAVGIGMAFDLIAEFWPMATDDRADYAAAVAALQDTPPVRTRVYDVKR